MTHDHDRALRIALHGYDPLEFVRPAEVAPAIVKPPRRKRRQPKDRRNKIYVLNALGLLVEERAPALYAQGLNDHDIGRIVLPDEKINDRRQYVFRWRQRHGLPARCKGNPNFQRGR